MLPCVIALLLAIILALLLKLVVLRRAAWEIQTAFRERLEQDTNTLITLSCRDKRMRALAADINVQLRVLREQRRRYQNGDRELKEAVTNIAHDLRTPLTSLCGYAELLEREPLNENAARYLALIRSRADALKALTQELFRYSIITSAPEALPLEPVDLRVAVEEGLLAFYAAFTQRGIAPDVSLPDTAVIRPLNREAIARVIGNLLSNALKYSDGDLSVMLTPEGELVFENAASSLSNVQVGRLFDRFFTVETARHTTGLGLSIARTLVERMHGTITAAYQDGRLIIRVHFPAPG